MPILGLIGIFEMKGATGSHRVTAAPIAWLVLSLLAGAGMGAVRGATVRIWRAEDGSAWRQGTVLTTTLWIVSLATHLVSEPTTATTRIHTYDKKEIFDDHNRRADVATAIRSMSSSAHRAS